MEAPGWLTQELADVPAGTAWLSERERQVLEGLHVEQRRASWRLGRWTAKVALGRWLTIPLRRIEVLAADDGAPEAWINGQPASVSISISHRGGQGLAVVAGPPVRAGCDLELIEPRSRAFVHEWLAAPEQELIASCEESERALWVNLIWTAKEAAAKVCRQGLRLDVRRSIVTASAATGADGTWQSLRVESEVGASVTGWWRANGAWVMSVAEDRPTPPPRSLD